MFMRRAAAAFSVVFGVRGLAIPPTAGSEDDVKQSMEDDAAEELMFGQPVKINDCSDFRINYTESVNESWGELFRAWDGKRIVVGGDSLAGNMFATMFCTMKHLGQAHLKKMVRATWNSDHHVQIHNINQDFKNAGRPSREESFAIFQMSATIGPHKLSIDYVRYWSFTSSCHTCLNPTDTERCSICPCGEASVVPFDMLAHISSDYDKVFLNMGHDMIDTESSEACARASIKSKVHGLGDAFHARNIEDKLVLLEHLPQHFASADGTGNFNGSCNLHKDVGNECHCDADPSHLPNLHKQTIHEQNLLLGEAARERSTKIPVCRMWEQFMSAGEHHTANGDCTHYKKIANLWDFVVRELAALSR